MEYGEKYWDMTSFEHDMVIAFINPQMHWLLHKILTRAKKPGKIPAYMGEWIYENPLITGELLTVRVAGGGRIILGIDVGHW